MSTESKPIIVLVPGLWLGPTIYNNVVSQLHSFGYEALTVALLSTGAISPGNGDIHDDEAAIRVVVQKLVEEEEKDVVLVGHSAGGFLACGAIEGLTAKARSEKRGGVKKIVFLAGAVADVGHVHDARPFMIFDHKAGTMMITIPRTSLFNDLSDVEAEKWLAVLKPQPSEGWQGGTTLYAAWKEVPSVYLLSEKDNLLPVPLQEMWANLAGSRLERVEAGHCAMLSCPERVVEVIVGAAEE